MEYDVFISHASGDKENFVEPRRIDAEYQTTLAPIPGPPAAKNRNLLLLPESLSGQPTLATWPPEIHMPCLTKKAEGKGGLEGCRYDF